jgi:alkylation response protein AidB-like acyl-CoA dehydrogenase
MRSFNATRPLVAIMAVGIGRAALDAAIDLIEKLFRDVKAIDIV